MRRVRARAFRDRIIKVTADLIEALAITGTPQRARSRLDEVRDVGVDLPILTMPQGASAEAIRATLEALGGD